MAGQVFAVASGKGGVGKTTTVVNLGVVLRRADHTVALVDADLGMANLGTMVGVESELTLHDVLAGEATVEEALVEEAPGFGILTGSTELEAYPEADPSALREVIRPLTEDYDFVLIDTGAGMSHEDVLPLGLSDRVVLVTTPDPAAIGDTRKTAELAALAEGSVRGLIVTMADDATDAADIASQIGVDLLGVIPYDPSVRRSTASATPLEAVAPESPAATAYREVATVLVDGGSGTATSPASPVAARSGTDGGTSDGTAENPSSANPAPGDGGPAADGDPSPDADPEGSADSDADGAEAEPEPTADDDGSIDEGDGADVTDSAEEAGPDADDTAAADDADEGMPAEDGGTAAGERETPGSDDAATDEDDLDEYLEEFEDVEPASSGGLFARLRRLFR